MTRTMTRTRTRLPYWRSRNSFLAASRFYPLVARDPDRGPRFPLPRADSRISLPALDFLKILNRFLVIVDLEKRALTMQWRIDDDDYALSVSTTMPPFNRLDFKLGCFVLARLVPWTSLLVVMACFSLKLDNLFNDGVFYGVQYSKACMKWGH